MGRSINIAESRAYRANKDFIIKIEDERAIVGNVKFTVLPSSNDELKLEISRESNGSKFESAKDKAENIEYGLTNDSSSLYLNSFFSAFTNFAHVQYFFNATRLATYYEIKK